MTKEKKSEYTLRISQANQVQLIVILYEMTITYIEDAIKAHELSDKDTMEINLKRAISCIEEMQSNLHYEYELAKKLKQIYLYMKKQLRDAYISGNITEVDSVLKQLSSLKDAYKSIEREDNSKPVMVHTQAVITGMTYNKTRALDSLTTECESRGYRV